MDRKQREGSKDVVQQLLKLARFALSSHWEVERFLLLKSIILDRLSNKNQKDQKM